MNPMLKGPIAERLKLECDKLLSSVAFKFKLRRYTMINAGDWRDVTWPDGWTAVTKVRRCRLTLSHPR
jgi:hypothetical protein